jgi:hypothetical protein
MYINMNLIIAPPYVYGLILVMVRRNLTGKSSSFSSGLTSFTFPVLHSKFSGYLPRNIWDAAFNRCPVKKSINQSFSKLRQ